MKESRIKKLKIAVWLPLLALIIGAIFVAALVRGVRVENEKHAEKLERMKELCKERNSLYEKQNDLKGQKWKLEKALER